jgi:hypothetical protein
MWCIIEKDRERERVFVWCFSLLLLLLYVCTVCTYECMYVWKLSRNKVAFFFFFPKVLDLARARNPTDRRRPLFFLLSPSRGSYNTFRFEYHTIKMISIWIALGCFHTVYRPFFFFFFFVSIRCHLEMASVGSRQGKSNEKKEDG